MDAANLDVCVRRTIRHLLVNRWRAVHEGAGRYLLQPGSWHTCAPSTCRMVQLRTRVVVTSADGRMDVRWVGEPSPDRGMVMLVDWIFVCNATGRVHECTGEPTRECGDGATCVLTHRPLASTAPPSRQATVFTSSMSGGMGRRAASLSLSTADVVRDILLAIAFSLWISASLLSWLDRFLITELRFF